MGVKALRNHSQSKWNQKLVKGKEQVTIFFKKKEKRNSKQRRCGIIDFRGYSSAIMFEETQHSLVQNTIPSTFWDGGKINVK